MQTVGQNAFRYAKVKSVVYNAPSVSIGCFSYSSIESVTLGDKVKMIEVDAFRGCEFLSSVNLGSAVEVIGNDSFTACRVLTTITIPKSVKTIERYAFMLVNFTRVTFEHKKWNLEYNEYDKKQITATDLSDEETSAMCLRDNDYYYWYKA